MGLRKILYQKIRNRTNITHKSMDETIGYSLSCMHQIDCYVNSQTLPLYFHMRYAYDTHLGIQNDGQTSTTAWGQTQVPLPKDTNTIKSEWDEDVVVGVWSVKKNRICNNQIGGTTRVMQASKKTTEKRLQWNDLAMGREKERIARRRVEIREKRRSGWPNLPMSQVKEHRELC